MPSVLCMKFLPSHLGPYGTCFPLPTLVSQHSCACSGIPDGVGAAFPRSIPCDKGAACRTLCQSQSSKTRHRLVTGLPVARLALLHAAPQQEPSQEGLPVHSPSVAASLWWAQPLGFPGQLLLPMVLGMLSCQAKPCSALMATMAPRQFWRSYLLPS